MPFIHIPVVEIMHFLMKFRKNRPFMRFSRLFMMVLVTLSAISYPLEWAKGYEPDFAGCVLGKYECYQGLDLDFLEYISQLNVPYCLLLLPLIDIILALLLLLKPRRTYLVLLVLSFSAFFIHALSGPDPYVHVKVGNGGYLHFFAMFMLIFLSFPLILDEQIRLHPNWDYRKHLPGYLCD
jgi:hypothetical protein